MVGRIVLVGAGRTGDSLVGRLARVAPVDLLDTSASALEERSAPADATWRPPRSEKGQEGTTAPFQHEVTHRVADGTSRLVLEDLRRSAEGEVAMVATTGSDRANLEICRLANELDYHPVIAVAIDPREVPKYEACGAHAIARATLLGDVVERAILYEGLAFASNIGLGQGDVIEIRILPSSPAIGIPLHDLRPIDWLVAAIYRDGALVIPTGETRIEAEDRALIVGQPETLPFVAANLSKGEPDFPRRYGSTIVVYLPDGPDRSIEAEAEVVALTTRAEGLVRVYPRAEPFRAVLAREASAEAAGAPAGSKWLTDAPLVGADLEQQAGSIFPHRPGLVVAKAEPRTWRQRLWGRGGRDAALCNLLNVPVLFPRGLPVYDRLLYVLTSGTAHVGAADAAIDLARMLALPLWVLRIDLPRFYAAPDPAVERVQDIVQRRARLYGMAAKLVRLEGNPVRQVRRFVSAGDMLVVGRSRSRRDSFSAPDVALRIAREAPCSTMVITR